MELLEAVEKVTLETKVSAKGNPYVVLSVRFKNGYVKETFLNSAEQMLLEKLI